MNTPLIPLDKQQQVLDSLGDKIKTQGSPLLKEKIQENAQAAYDSYNKYDCNLVTPLHGISSGLNTAGNVLLATGLLGGVGYGGYKLYQYLKNRKKTMDNSQLNKGTQFILKRAFEDLRHKGLSYS